MSSVANPAIDLNGVARQVVEMATGDLQIEAFVVHESETEVRAYQGGVESFTASESFGIGVRVIDGGRQGFAYAGTLSPDAIREVLAEARDNASFGTPDEHAGLATPDSVKPTQLDVYRAELADVATEDKVAMAIELERATLAADPRIIGLEDADYVDVMAEMAVVSTEGIDATARETACYVSASALAEENGETQTGFGFSVGRTIADLDVARAAADAAERATRLLGSTKPPSARLTVVFDPFVTAQLIGIIGETLTGEAVVKGRSMFADRLGEAVASSLITLVDDPTDPRAFTASMIDAEGLATRRNVLLDQGVVSAFLQNSYSGRRMKVPSTGSAVRGGYKSTPGVGAQALQLAPGRRLAAEIIADIEDGFLVQGVSGMHSGVNPVSGDFSTGAEGLRIRNGELAEPIREVTIASTLQRLLHDVIEVGGDTEWLPMNAAGVTLAIADVTMSGS